MIRAVLRRWLGIEPFSVTEAHRLGLTKGDVLIVMAPGHLTNEQSARIREVFAQAADHATCGLFRVPILVVDGGLVTGVMRATDQIGDLLAAIAARDTASGVGAR